MLDGRTPSVSAQDRGGKQLDDIHHTLRELILDGVLSPDDALSQVKLSEQLGVSRTPLREALRMLEREGLVESLPNKKSRVRPTSPEDLDGLYSLRIATEALAARASVPNLTTKDVDSLRESFRAMQRISPVSDAALWEVHHVEFHRQLLSKTGLRLTVLCAQYADHSRRYRRRFVQQAQSMNASDSDHEQLLHSAEERNGNRAAMILARHLAQTALTLILEMEPSHDAVQTRCALRLVESTSGRSATR